ncbi:hypothetical protein ATERTT37_003731 [Aspergillus terreus]
MTSSFHVKDHVIDTQYIREYHRATATPDAPLKLCVKQYIPTDYEPQLGDVTIIATHGTGFPKELYEPLWEDLLNETKISGVRIRAIWIADASNQGASGVLNEKNLGNDPSSHDHSRDLIHLVNHFRDEMPRPIMGIGHSLGCEQLVFASLFHPRLFTSLLLIEPHMIDRPSSGEGPRLLGLTYAKRDIWPSRAHAVAKARHVFRRWDPRVLARWCDVGYRDLPTAVYPDAAAAGDRPVTLTTTKYQEIMLYTRLNTQRHPELGRQQPYEPADPSETPPPHDPLVVPDMLGPLVPGQLSYRAESMLGFMLAPHVRPSVLYVSGAESTLHRSGTIGKVARRTGTGFSGSGGMARGRVRHVVVEGTGHTLPLEKVAATAETLAGWMREEVLRWRQDEERVAAGWEGLPLREKSGFTAEWVEVMEKYRAEATKTKAKI